jgi:hypothetical protein
MNTPDQPDSPDEEPRFSQSDEAFSILGLHKRKEAERKALQEAREFIERSLREGPQDQPLDDKP